MSDTKPKKRKMIKTEPKTSVKSEPMDEEDLPLSRIRDSTVPKSPKIEIKKEKKSAKKSKKSTPKKKTIKQESDEDEEESLSSTGDDNEDEDEEEEEEDEGPPKKKKKTKAKGKGKVKAEETESPTPKKTRRKSSDNNGEPLYEWWKSENQLPEGVNWNTLEHNGVLFPPPYKPHNVKMLYDGKPVDLTPEEEEAATFYAQYLQSDHVKKEVFNTNFFNDFLAILNKGKKTKHVIRQFDKCDFTPIYNYLMEQKEMRKNRSKEAKEAEKQEKARLQEIYGWAVMDGYRQKIANYRVEPPGLFLGRGDHPKAGMIKKRIMPEDVTINIGKESKVPESPIPGSNWKEVCHNSTVTWLAFWKENINDQFKYVWLSPSSRIKGQSDMKKFETARKLATCIGDIRKRYMKELKSEDILEKQRATALWFIDNLALRVGNEKGEDEADTVGCCSLRVEHVSLQAPDSLNLDFLGKDSMRYQRTVKVDPLVFQNIGQFMKGKSGEDDLFDKLSTAALNAHLKEQMPGLTAKVFRTYNASYTLQKELDKMTDNYDLVEEKVLYYNRCNRVVAILCNHQRSLPKTFNEQMERLEEKTEEIKWYISAVQQQIKDIKASKSLKDEIPIPARFLQKKKKSTTPTSTPKKEKEKKKEKKEKKEDTSDKGKKKETPKKKKKKSKDEELEEMLNEEEEISENEDKMFKLPQDLDKAEKQLEKLKERLKKWEIKKTEKEDLKTVALGTSKINYLDPRITAAWCKAHDVPIERIFSKTLRDKFPWALDVEAAWKF